MTQQTPFEQVLGAFLDDGHEVKFKKDDGIIFLRLDGNEHVSFSGCDIEQIGQLMISCAVSGLFKRIDGGT